MILNKKLIRTIKIWNKTFFLLCKGVSWEFLKENMAAYRHVWKQNFRQSQIQMNPFLKESPTKSR